MVFTSFSFFFFYTVQSHGTASLSLQNTNRAEVGQKKWDSGHDEAERKTAQKHGAELVHFTRTYINTQEAHLTRNNHLQGDHVSHLRTEFVRLSWVRRWTNHSSFSAVVFSICLQILWPKAEHSSVIKIHAFPFLYNNHMVISCSDESLLVGGHGVRDHKVAFSFVREKNTIEYKTTRT